MDRLDAMRVFVATVDAGSLAGAARVLRRSPAAASRAIAFLEDHVGGPLLHRTTRVMRVTEVGEAYVQACRHVLIALDEADRQAVGGASSPRGLLTLSAPPIAGEDILRPVLDAFLQAYPEISARLLLLDRQVNLVEEGVDLALRIGDLSDSGLIAVKVGAEVRRVVSAAPSYLANRPSIARPGDLADHDIVAMSHFGEDRWIFPPTPGAAGPRTVMISPRVVVSSVRAATSSAVAGLGVTRLYSYHLAEHIRSGALQILLAEDEPAPLPVHLVTRPGVAAAPKTRAFLDFATPRLRAAFSGLAAEARSLPIGRA